MNNNIDIMITMHFVVISPWQHFFFKFSRTSNCLLRCFRYSIWNEDAHLTRQESIHQTVNQEVILPVGKDIHQQEEKKVIWKYKGNLF